MKKREEWEFNRKFAQRYDGNISETTYPVFKVTILFTQFLFLFFLLVDYDNTMELGRQG